MAALLAIGPSIDLRLTQLDVQKDALARTTLGAAIGVAFLIGRL